jgi:hypothetical protein
LFRQYTADLSNFLHFWSREKLTRTYPPNTYPQIHTILADKYSLIVDSFDQVIKGDKGLATTYPHVFGAFEFDDWKVAWLLINSRHWILPAGELDDIIPDSGGEERTHCIAAPIADLMNFGTPCTTASFDAATKSFQILASCPFKEGDEISFYYSDECRDIFRIEYGFTHEFNKAGRCEGY